MGDKKRVVPRPSRLTTVPLATLTSGEQAAVTALNVAAETDPELIADLARYVVRVHSDSHSSAGKVEMFAGVKNMGAATTTLAEKLKAAGVGVSQYRHGSYVQQARPEEAADLEQWAPQAIATFWPGQPDDERSGQLLFPYAELLSSGVGTGQFRDEMTFAGNVLNFWNVRAPSGTTAALATAPDGRKALALDQGGSAGQLVASTGIVAGTTKVAAPGMRVEGRFDLRAQSTPRECRAEIRWMNSSYATISTSEGSLVTTTTTGWTTATVVATAPAGAAWCALQVRRIGFPIPNGERFWLSNASFTERTGRLYDALNEEDALVRVASCASLRPDAGLPVTWPFRGPREDDPTPTTTTYSTSTAECVHPIKIDDEWMGVSALASELNNGLVELTVIRGLWGTTPAPHADGSKVFVPVYVGSISDGADATFAGSPAVDDETKGLRYVVDLSKPGGVEWLAKRAAMQACEWDRDGVHADVPQSSDPAEWDGVNLGPHQRAITHQYLDITGPSFYNQSDAWGFDVRSWSAGIPGVVDADSLLTTEGLAHLQFMKIDAFRQHYARWGLGLGFPFIGNNVAAQNNPQDPLQSRIVTSGQYQLGNLEFWGKDPDTRPLQVSAQRDQLMELFRYDYPLCMWAKMGQNALTGGPFDSGAGGIDDADRYHYRRWVYAHFLMAWRGSDRQQMLSEWGIDIPDALEPVFTVLLGLPVVNYDSWGDIPTPVAGVKFRAYTNGSVYLNTTGAPVEVELSDWAADASDAGLPSVHSVTIPAYDAAFLVPTSGTTTLSFSATLPNIEATMAIEATPPEPSTVTLAFSAVLPNIEAQMSVTSQPPQAWLDATGTFPAQQDYGADYYGNPNQTTGSGVAYMFTRYPKAAGLAWRPPADVCFDANGDLDVSPGGRFHKGVAWVRQFNQTYGTSKKVKLYLMFGEHTPAAWKNAMRSSGLLFTGDGLDEAPHPCYRVPVAHDHDGKGLHSHAVGEPNDIFEAFYRKAVQQVVAYAQDNPEVVSLQINWYGGEYSEVYYGPPVQRIGAAGTNTNPTNGYTGNQWAEAMLRLVDIVRDEVPLRFVVGVAASGKGGYYNTTQPDFINKLRERLVARWGSILSPYRGRVVLMMNGWFNDKVMGDSLTVVAPATKSAEQQKQEQVLGIGSGLTDANRVMVGLQHIIGAGVLSDDFSQANGNFGWVFGDIAGTIPNKRTLKDSLGRLMVATVEPYLIQLSSPTSPTYNPYMASAEASIAGFADLLAGVTPPADTTPPNTTIATPTAGQAFTTGSVAISGSAVDNVAVSAVRLQIRKGTSSYTYWNGSAWSATVGYVTATLATPGASTSWSYALGGLSSDSYLVTATAVDSSNNLDPTPATVAFTYTVPVSPSYPPVPSGTLSLTSLSGISVSTVYGSTSVDVRLPSGTGPFPLVILGHGNNGNGQAMNTYHQMLGQRGYILASPSMGPIAGQVNSGRGNVIMRAVIDRIFELAATPGHPLNGKVHTTRVGYIGTSMGGFVGYKFFDTAQADPRIACFILQATAHTSRLISASGHDWADVLTPVLHIHGTGDTTITPTEGRAAYNLLQGPKGKIEITGMGHDLIPPAPLEPTLTNIFTDARTAFLRRWLHGLDSLGTIATEVAASNGCAYVNTY